MNVVIFLYMHAVNILPPLVIALVKAQRGHYLRMFPSCHIAFVRTCTICADMSIIIVIMYTYWNVAKALAYQYVQSAVLCKNDGRGSRQQTHTRLSSLDLRCVSSQRSVL